MKFKIFSAFTSAIGLGLLLALTVAAQGAKGVDANLAIPSIAPAGPATKNVALQSSMSLSYTYPIAFTPEFTTYLPLIFRYYNSLLLYFDDFSDPNSGWWSGENESVKAGYLNGEYQILIKNTKTGWIMSDPDLVLLSDYRIEVDARQASSNASSYSYGLMFGRQISGDKFEHYFYRVGPTLQEYRLSKRNMDGSSPVLIDWTYSSAIHQGMGTNHLRVDRIGTVIYLYINDTLVTTFTDSSFTSPGRDAGVLAFSNYSAPVDVRFDNFSVYRTP